MSRSIGLWAGVTLVAMAACSRDKARPGGVEPASSIARDAGGPSARLASSAAITAAPARRPPLSRALPGPATSVRVEDGQVVVRDAEGHEAALTSSGSDVSAALSDDGHLVVFARSLDDAGDRRDLHVAGVDGSPSELLLSDDPSVPLEGDPDLSLTGFFNVEVMPDNRRALFSVQNGRGEAIVAIDLKTKKMKYLSPSFGYTHVLIHTGPNQGRLLIINHTQQPGAGPIDECWLIDGVTGKMLRDVSELCGDVKGLDNPRVRKALAF